KRYVLPSIRARPHMAWVAPVQCLVQLSVRRSLMDQTLKYGSCVTSGTAGGRNASSWAGASKGLSKTKQKTPLHMVADGCRFIVYSSGKYLPRLLVEQFLMAHPCFQAIRPPRRT